MTTENLTWFTYTAHQPKV